MNRVIRIEDRQVGPGHPAYFIADIAANHDGDLGRAKQLIHMAAEAGADAAKFQHFHASSIVSDEGFRALSSGQSHQASWGKSVYEVYEDASVDPDWTPALKEACDEAGVHFFTAPYAIDLADAVDPYVPAFKIGSGDITWHALLSHVGRKGKPVLMASGASELEEVRAAMAVLCKESDQVLLMQCNTNYTASLDNFRHVNLRVLETYKQAFPGIPLGLSDHTPGHATVLGAVALGACAIEKHFTDDVTRTGPDHAFSMDPKSWRDMVDRTRELEASLGDGIKRVEANESETVVLQRRAMRATQALEAGAVFAEADWVALRPCPSEAITPDQAAQWVGRRLKVSKQKGDVLCPSDFE